MWTNLISQEVRTTASLCGVASSPSEPRSPGRPSPPVPPSSPSLPLASTNKSKPASICVIDVIFPISPVALNPPSLLGTSSILTFLPFSPSSAEDALVPVKDEAYVQYQRASIKLVSIVKFDRTGIKAWEVDCFRGVFDCVPAPFADITT